MAATVTLGLAPNDVQGSPVAIADDLVSIIAIRAGVAFVSLIITGASARVCWTQTVAQGDARPTANYTDFPVGAYDVGPGRIGLSGAGPWRLAVSNVSNGQTPTINTSVSA